MITRAQLGVGPPFVNFRHKVVILEIGEPSEKNSVGKRNRVTLQLYV